jgi:transcription initiation factor IIE alpha subunit
MGNGSHLLKGFTLHTSSVFLHLKKHGQLLDSEIAAATGIALPDVHDSISKLVEQGEISRCSVTCEFRPKLDSWVIVKGPFDSTEPGQ